MSATSTTQVTSHAAFALLPSEIIESIQQTYFLHLLVNDPGKVVPDGKSVLSMMQHADFRLEDQQGAKDEKQQELFERVKSAAHKAFWAEAKEVLSSPIPSAQIPRLKRLYFDLLESLNPLFPPKHIILLTLAAPPPPTTSPLLSTVDILIQILKALRQRCAPARDTQIDHLIASVSLPPPAIPTPNHTSQDSSSSSSTQDNLITPLAEFVVEHFKAILALAEDMKGDLNNFVLGSMTEDQLNSVLSSTTMTRERESVLQLWDGEENVRTAWRGWLAEGNQQDPASASVQGHGWVGRLCKALGSDKAVYCVPPSALALASGTQSNADERPPDQEANKLPPQLFYCAPTILYMQNYIQAIVITTALRLLALSTPQTLQPITSSPISEFIHRVWTLLLAEVDSEDPQYNDTKIINLADEVVRVRQLCNTAVTSHSNRNVATSLSGPELPILIPPLHSPSSSPSSPPPLHLLSLPPEEESRIRASVDRTLRSTDPVFLLLRKRLLGALEERMIKDLGRDRNGNNIGVETTGSATGKTNVSQTIPERMQTGKDLPANRPAKRIKLAFEDEATPHKPTRNAAHAFKVQAFEDPVLEQAIGVVYTKLMACIEWTESVWVDLV